MNRSPFRNFTTHSNYPLPHPAKALSLIPCAHLYSTHSRRDPAFREHLESAHLEGVCHVGAAAELHGDAHHIQHTHLQNTGWGSHSSDGAPSP